ncbi:MAG: glycosyl hydrolase [Patescibacteria group bacterium]
MLRWFGFYVVVFSIGFIILIGVFFSSESQIPVRIQKVPPRKVFIGAWVGDFWNDNTRTLNTSKLTDFESSIHKKMAIANLFIDWTYLEDPILLTNLAVVKQKGWTPMISSNPMFFEKCAKGNLNLYSHIASGKCDSFLESIAVNLGKHPSPVLFRFAWEMNLPDMYWSIESQNSTPKDFISAWKHMHTVLNKAGATNVSWVLSFNTSHPKTVPYEKLYPGDDYVDWVAIDGYNWGTTQDWSNWADFNAVFFNSYKELTAITTKPVMLSEVNSAPDGGDKAAWLKDMLEVQIPNNYKQINAIIFFNENKIAGESVDWRISKDVLYVKAVELGLNNPLYQSNYTDIY